MTKFHKIIRQYQLREASQDQMAQQNAALDPTAQQVAQVSQTEPSALPDKPETNVLTSEGEVELVRLVRQALLLDVKPASVPTDLVDVEINQNNAREVYIKLKDYISTFTG